MVHGIDPCAIPFLLLGEEYVIMYSRVHAGDSEKHIENLTRVPYHLQLPVYWANCDLAHCGYGTSDLECRLWNLLRLESRCMR